MATINKKRQLGRPVSIVGAGLSQFGAFPDKDTRDLFVEAFQDMVQNIDRGFDIQDIECAYVGNYSSDLFEGQKKARIDMVIDSADGRSQPVFACPLDHCKGQASRFEFGDAAL